jgi:hypothetical protein
MLSYDLATYSVTTTLTNVILTLESSALLFKPVPVSKGSVSVSEDCIHQPPQSPYHDRQKHGGKHGDDHLLWENDYQPDKSPPQHKDEGGLDGGLWFELHGPLPPV